MRKRFLLLSALVLCLLLCACGTKQDGTNASSEIELSTTAEETVALTEKEQIEKILSERIEEEYYNTVIDGITINDDLGTEKEDDYIALVYLTWNTRNSGKLSKTVLKMYSDDLAATLAEENDSVQEIAIFWTVPYLKGSAKCSYERKNSEMYVADMYWDSVFK